MSWLAGALTFDSDKIEAIPGSAGLAVRLALQEQWTDDFSSDFGHLTEVDSGANVEVSGGKLKVDGTNVWDANGAYLTDLLSVATPGRFVIETTIPDDIYQYCVIGLAAAAALNQDDEGLKVYFSNTGGLVVNMKTANVFVGAWEAETTYTCTFEWDADKTMRAYIDGGSYDNRLLAEIYNNNMGANVGFQINQFSNETNPREHDNLTLSQGYDTGGEPAYRTIDAGAGKTWDGASIAAWAASLAESDDSELDYTNATYRYDYSDSDTPDWTTGRTFAQLKAWLEAIDTDKRYLHVGVELNSDGDTQCPVALPDAAGQPSITSEEGTYPEEGDVLTGSGQYGPNGDDYTPSYSPDFPDPANVLVGETTDGEDGTFDEAARNTDPGIANVKAPTAYKIHNADLVGTYSASVPTFTRPGLAVVDDGDGSVTATVTNNAGQTSRLKYKKASDTDWTVHGTSKTGNGTITDLTGLDYSPDTLYKFKLVPYDAVSGAEGDSSDEFPLMMHDSSAAATTSAHDDEMIDDLDEHFDEFARALVFTAYGQSPVSTTGIVQEEATPFREDPDEDTVTYRGTIRMKLTVATNPDRRDSFTVDGVEYPVKDIPNRGKGTVLYSYERRVRVRTSAAPHRGG